MNTGSIIVIAIIAVLMALAIWRVVRKGAPCECGGSRKLCACKSGKSGGCDANCCSCHSK